MNNSGYIDAEQLKAKIEQAKNDEGFRKVTGSGSSSKARVAKRVEFAKAFFRPYTQ